MTINRIITNRFKLEIQSKKANWTQTAGSVDWIEFSVDWPCTWKFSRFRKLSVSSFSRLCKVFQSTESSLETLGFQVQSTEQSFQSTESCLGCFSAYSNEEQILPKCNRTNIGSKGLCQSATRPYMLLDASPKAWSNIHIRIFTQIWLKNPKIGIFTKPIQIKSKCTWRSVRNSYPTTKDNYSHRCEIKISPFHKNNGEEAWKQRENQPLFKSNSISLIISFKRRTFPKLGLGIS